MNLLAPFGFYGAGNIGDESTLQGFAYLVSGYSPKMNVWVASQDPSHTARVEPSLKYYSAVGCDLRRRWARYSSVACVVPGGTPIMDVLGAWPLSELSPLVEAAHAQGKPIVFIGTGTETLRRQESKRILADIFATKVQHWTVRCQRDRDRLTEYGVPGERVTVTADMAWLLDAATPDFGRQYLEKLGLQSNVRFVGVNVNSESFMLEQEPQLFEKLGRFLDLLVEQYDCHILFMCNEVREDDSFDKAASLKIQACMAHKDSSHLLPNRYWSPQEMLSLIGCCHATVSTRYHFCLFAALQGVPFVSVERSDKIADLCWDLKWPYRLSLSDLSTPLLFHLFSDLENHRSHLVTVLKERFELMRERALDNRAALDSVVSAIKA
jgi:polysaccharide pyruvyl transferase WcaK-like protein